MNRKLVKTILSLLLCLSLLTAVACAAGASSGERETESHTAPDVFGAASEPPVAFAPGYSDRDSIAPAYTKAVDYLTEQGILNGYDDGRFHPADTLTRDQGAKIITYLILGPEAAEKLTCDKAPFTDVPVTLWSAPAVAWCEAHDIVHGVGNGSFRPGEPLTGQQFAKMLMNSYRLGDPSRYVGDGWGDRVSADALNLGLLEGDTYMCTDQPITRQQAALMAYNAQHQEPGASEPAAPEPDSQPGNDLETPEIEIDLEDTELGTTPIEQPQTETPSDEQSEEPTHGEEQSEQGANPEEQSEQGANPEETTQPETDPKSDVVVDPNGDILLPEVP